MKLYTKTGDQGTTSLVGGQRVAKNDIRIEAYGTVDELSAHIGYLHDISTNSHKPQLISILSDLMVCGALLAAEDQTIAKLPKLTQSQVEQLEKWTDILMQDVPTLRHFTLPTGNLQLSYSHICRTVCRRAERCIIASRDHHPEIPAVTAQYINRLSDYLYAFGRNTTHSQQSREYIWDPTKI